MTIVYSPNTPDADTYRAGARRPGGWAPVALSGLLTALGALALVATIVLVVWTRLGQRADERSRWSIAVPEPLGTLVVNWLDTVSVSFVIVGLAVAVVLALARRRLGAGVAAAVLVAGANVTTQVLKEVVPRPEYGVGPAMNSLPSGHTTVMTSLALALVVVAPRALRPLLVVVTSAAATFTGAATILERWHRPSDVIAAFGVCAIWAGVALVVLAAQSVRRRARTREPAPTTRFGLHLGAGVAGAVLVGAGLIVGGLVSHGTPADVLVGGVMLTATGLTGALLAALVAAICDGSEPGGASRSRSSSRLAAAPPSPAAAPQSYDPHDPYGPHDPYDSPTPPTPPTRPWRDPRDPRDPRATGSYEG